MKTALAIGHTAVGQAPIALVPRAIRGQSARGYDDGPMRGQSARGYDGRAIRG